nr:hypothetical protein [Tanacetum cinerariifolium]
MFLEFALRNRVLLRWCLIIEILLWTVLINSSLVWLMILILIEIIALGTRSEIVGCYREKLENHFLLESKEFEWEEEIGGGAFAFALTLVTLLLEYLTFDLLSMIDKHSWGILSKKFPSAAESRAS